MFPNFSPMLGEPTPSVLDELVAALTRHRAASSSEDWKTFCASFKSDHERVWQVLMACPMTRHSNQRPRGYPGDADLIDYIYSQNPRQGTTETGKQVFTYTANSPSSRAVRNRKAVLAQYIDETAKNRHGDCRVLSLACGHAREVMDSVALREGRATFLAMDQDEDSIAEVRRACTSLPVDARIGTVRQWLKGQYTDLTDFDLVYACGLYDYLNQSTAAALSARLFASLRGGGTLLIPNFLPDMFDVGYLECCMDWWLIYRDESALRLLLTDIPPAQIASTRFFTEPAGNIGFLEVVKAQETHSDRSAFGKSI